MTCPSCAHSVPEDARFCPSCGHSLAAAPTEERRVVTVLFGDLVGFTALAEHRDPEQVKRLVDACFERLVDDITSFGGRVDKLLGDGIVALFGAPVAHEDDAERAVRAALRMQETLGQLVHELGDDEPTVRMRIGINTGEVLVGTLAGTDYTAMGDVVNAAARLQAAAPPGAVLVGDVTQSRTSDAVRYEPAGEMLLRGRERPIRTWLAVEPISLPGGRRRRRELRLVGRDQEMALAGVALDVAIRSGRGVLLAVEGEGGVGKSRLVEELLGPIHNRATVLSGTCVPYGESNVWWPVASALIDHLGIDEDASLAEVREVARIRADELLSHGTQRVAPVEADEVVEAFLHLLGYESALDGLDPAGARDALYGAVCAVLSRLTDSGPLVLAITDVHWADPRVLELLGRVLGQLAARSFALVTTARPDVDLSWPPTTTRFTVVSLPLEPLGRDAAAELASEVVGGALHPSVAAQLYDRSGGNPLFLEELAELVGEGGEVSELPDSLRGLVAARLDRLAPGQRAVLDNAAVLGTAGNRFALERFATKLGQPFDDELLDGLVEAGLLEVEGRRWRFRSDSVREVAYQTLTKAVRAQRHAGVAASMVSAGERAPIDDLAHHAATAAELVIELGPVPGVPSTIRADAVELLRTSAMRAMEQGSLQHVVRTATRALDLLGEDADRAGRPLLLLRAEALAEARDDRTARTDALRLLTAAMDDADLVAEAQARRLLGVLHQQDGDLDGARRELGAAVELLRTVDAAPELGKALRSRGFLELFGGSLRDAEWFFGEAEAVYTELGDRRGLAWIDQHRAWASFLAGHVDEAAERLQQAAATLQEVGDRSGVGWAYGLLAFVHFFHRRFDESARLARLVSEEAHERGDEWAVGMMQVLEANLHLWQGRPEEALALADQARSRFKRLGDRYGQVMALAPLMRALVATGRQASAARAVEEMLVLGEHQGGRDTLVGMAVAGTAVHAGDAVRALRLAEEANEVARELDLGPHEPLVVAALALAQLGRPEEARTALDQLEAGALEHPFTGSVAAMVAVVDGRYDDALTWAEGVGAADGASYFDRTIALTAAGVAAVGVGDPELGRSRLGAAVDEAVAAGDVVLTSLAARAHHRVLGEAHPHGDGDPTVLGPGWLELLDQLPTTQAVPR